MASSLLIAAPPSYMGYLISFSGRLCKSSIGTDPRVRWLARRFRGGVGQHAEPTALAALADLEGCTSSGQPNGCLRHGPANHGAKPQRPERSRCFQPGTLKPCRDGGTPGHERQPGEEHTGLPMLLTPLTVPLRALGPAHEAEAFTANLEAEVPLTALLA